MTDPVTIATTHDSPLFDPEDHRAAAAQQLGVEPSDIHCIDCGPDTCEEIKPNVFSEDGTVLKHRVVHYHRKTTWELRPRAAAVAEPSPPEPEIINQTPPQLHRGAKWHGTIQGVEATYISTGQDLVPLDSPHGQSVLDAIADENQAATGG